jgi:hypothetical protein
MQPLPTGVDVVHTWFGRNCATAIEREWESMDDVARCRLCPLSQCKARQRGHKHCLVGVNRYVAIESAALFAALDPGTWGSANSACSRVEVS